MTNIKQIKTIKRVKAFTGVGLFILGVLVFVFALVSGSEDGGLLRNSPNSLPWLLLLVLTLYSFRKPVFGGLLIILYGLALVYFFNFRGVNFFLTTFILTMIIPLLGFVILSCGYYLENVVKRNKETQ